MSRVFARCRAAIRRLTITRNSQTLRYINRTIHQSVRTKFVPIACSVPIIAVAALVVDAAPQNNHVDKYLVDSTLAEVEFRLAGQKDKYKRATHELLNDPSAVHRYLIAHGLSPTRAATAIIDTAHWRVDFHIDSVTAKSLENKIRAEAGSMFVSEGRARDGSPIVYNKKSTTPETDHETQLKQIVYTLERAVAQMDLAQSHQWYWLIDLKNWSSSSGTSLNESMRIVNVLRWHYPERLNKAVIIDAPMHFQLIWSAVRPLIPSKTREKVVFVNGEQAKEAIQSIVDDSQLERSFGGTGDVAFDVDRYVQNDPVVMQKR